MSSEWEIGGSTTGGDRRESPPAGNHLAVLVGLIDLGHQWQEPYDPEKDKGYWSRRAYFVWELCQEQIAGTTKNHVIAIDLTLSRRDTAKVAIWHKARTGQEIPNPYDPTAELGAHCMLNVTKNPKGYSKVSGVAAVPKALAGHLSPPTYPLTAVSLSQFRAGTRSVPDWVPYLFGSPIEEHVKACREIGGAKPSPRSKTGPSESAADPFDAKTLEDVF
jgi:hypothetical protein